MQCETGWSATQGHSFESLTVLEGQDAARRMRAPLGMPQNAHTTVHPRTQTGACMHTTRRGHTRDLSTATMMFLLPVSAMSCLISARKSG